MSERLAQELAPFGIRVAIIEPGLTRSAIFAKNIDAANLTGADDAPYRRMFQFYAAGFAQATDPVEVAEVIRHAIETDHPQLRYQVSWVAGPSSMDAPRSATTPGSPSAPSRTTTLTTPASRSCLTSTSPH